MSSLFNKHFCLLKETYQCIQSSLENFKEESRDKHKAKRDRIILRFLKYLNFRVLYCIVFLIFLL
jgi:hypothetical protein